jgi:acetyltransferase
LYGIATNRVAFAATPAAAVEAAHGIPGRLALKIVSPDIVHKSDVGGVALDLDGPAAVRIAADAMVERLSRLRPGARLDGFLVEEMIDRRRGQELILGLAVDATFGPVAAFGHGGTAVEVIDDKALGLPPLNLALARRMIEDTRVGRLLKGYRDQPAADLDAVAAAIVALSALAVDHPAIADLDINPLLASAAGVIALDVRIRVGAGHAGPVISPYPDHLATTLALPGGARLVARPIRPEDEPALRAMVRALAPEDRHFRFFVGLKDLDHHLAARLTQIDYDREMAFVAAPESAPAEFWGVVRLHGEPDGRRAEYAVTVRTDKKGLGLGTALMKLAIAEARRRGVAELWGDVLAGNARMLALAAELGFTAAPVPGDATLVRTVLRLPPSA